MAQAPAVCLPCSMPWYTNRYFFFFFFLHDQKASCSQRGLFFWATFFPLSLQVATLKALLTENPGDISQGHARLNSLKDQIASDATLEPAVSPHRMHELI